MRLPFVLFLKETAGAVPVILPEEVFYFPFDIELLAFWNIEEDWNPEEMPLLKQKPKELIKTEEKKK